MGARGYAALYVVWAAVCIAVAQTVNRIVPGPYMDEIFHVAQANAYCRGDWTHWDPALTTPPGLYLLPAAVAHLLRTLAPLLPRALLAPAADPCALPHLRRLNLLLALALPLLYTHLLRRLGVPTRRARTHALVFGLCPPLAWWAWMYYTDLFALAAVLAAWAAALDARYVLSAALCAGSLLFRQTNIVWLAFILAYAAVDALHSATGPGHLRDPLLADARPDDLVHLPVSLATAAAAHFPVLVPVVAPYLPVLTAAAAFVRWNGGIVLGDKAHHVPTVHVAQFYYCIASAGILFAPHLVTPAHLRRACASLVGTPRRAALTSLALFFMCWTIHQYTIAHPFLLADNRHYAFYVWRRIINVQPWARYALAPGYLAVATLLWHALARTRTMRLSTWALLTGATFFVLVPTPLLEPRYFLLPLVIVRMYLVPGTGTEAEGERRMAGTGTDADLESPPPTPPPPHKRNHAALRRRQRRGNVAVSSVSPSSDGSLRAAEQTGPGPGPGETEGDGHPALVLTLEVVLYLAIQVAALYLFLARPFAWPVAVPVEGLEQGGGGGAVRMGERVQRFMW